MTDKGTAITIGAYLDERRELVDEHLRKTLGRAPKGGASKKLADAMEYTLLAKGKRLRPIIAIAVYELFAKSTEEIVGPACAIEMIHSSSLMLDDLPCMDNARVRRWKKTNHLVFGESTTILASIALLIEAFKILSVARYGKVNSLAEEAAESIGRTGLIRGEFLDLESKKKTWTIKELEQCYYFKTGILFRAAARIGAILGGASPKQLSILGKFGRGLGVAFQIRDDIIDAMSSARGAGKDVRHDKKNMRPTYVSILGLGRSKAALSKKIEFLCADLRTLRLKTDTLAALTRSLTVI